MIKIFFIRKLEVEGLPDYMVSKVFVVFSSGVT